MSTERLRVIGGSLDGREVEIRRRHDFVMNVKGTLVPVGVAGDLQSSRRVLQRVLAGGEVYARRRVGGEFVLAPVGYSAKKIRAREYHRKRGGRRVQK